MPSTIGPYTQGEIPIDLTHAFTDADGQPIDIDPGGGWSCVSEHKLPDGTIDERDLAITNGEAGEVRYVWEPDDLAATGQHFLQFWAGDGTYLLASSKFTFWVEEAIATPTQNPPAA